MKKKENKKKAHIKSNIKYYKYGKDDRGYLVRIYTKREQLEEYRKNQDVVFHKHGWKVSDSAGH